MRELTLPDWMHLGDSLMVLSALDYVARVRGELFIFSQSPKVRTLLRALDLPHFIHEEAAPRQDVGELFLSIQDKYKNLCEPYRFLKHICERFGTQVPKELNTLRPRRGLPVREEPVVYGQFDARFRGMYVRKEVVRRFLDEKRVADFRLLGGPDTKKYLGDEFTYETGDLEFLCGKLLSCGMFCGANSGLAHLAGFLGVRCVVLCRVDRDCFSMYPDVTVVDHETLEVIQESRKKTEEARPKQGLAQLFDDKGSDKHWLHAYDIAYEKLFVDFRNSAFNLLEIGIAAGGSLLAWRDFLPAATVYGVDINKCAVSDPRIRVFQADAAKEVPAGIRAAGGFKVIIDDASHEPREQLCALFNYYPLLAPGGLYVIEDVHALDILGAVLRADVINLQKESGGRYDSNLLVLRKGASTK